MLTQPIEPNTDVFDQAARRKGATGGQGGLIIQQDCFLKFSVSGHADDADAADQRR